jgi:hypothetical protein
MKKHPRMLKLATKLLAGHSLEFVDRFATDFAEYRKGASDLHPALLDCFKRFESIFAIAFKHRHFIEQNHKLHTGVHGEALLTMIDRHERKVPFGYYERPVVDVQWHFTDPPSKTLH